MKLVSEAVAGGVTMVQLREREMAGGELLSLARRIKAVTRGKALLIINDRVDVAIAVESDGVQIPEAGLPTLTVRGLVGRYTVLGRSVHSFEAAQSARREGAEFVIAGTMYETPSHPDVELNGPALIEAITKDSSFPVLAIGGVKADKVEELVQAGAAGVAVTSAIAGAEDPKAAAQELMTALREAFANRTAAVASGSA